MEKACIRVAVVGIGRLGGLIVDMLIDQGYELVAAVNRDGPKIGRDVGEIHGGRRLGVLVTSDLGATLAATRPHIAVVVVADYFETVHSIYETCLRAGVRVVSAGTELSYPWLASASAAGELDAIARATGAALLGTGNQDYLMIRSGRELLGACVSATCLSHSRLLNVDAFGPETARTIGVGRPADEIIARDQARRATGRSGIYEMICHQLAADIGVTASMTRRRLVPAYASTDVYSRVLETLIPRGVPAGTREEIEIATLEGFSIRFTVEARVLAADERERIIWQVDGRPPLRAMIDALDGELTAAAQLVNRIPDVLSALPGLLSIERLPPVRLHITAPTAPSAVSPEGQVHERT